MVGALALLDGESPAYASGIMQIPGPALRIATAKLRECVETCPELRVACFRFVQSLTRQVMGVAARNARNTLAERCVAWLLMAHERMEGDELPVTHEALSSMLGVRRSGVTVATAALQRAGLIRTGRGRIRVTDRAGLEAIANGQSRVRLMVTDEEKVAADDTQPRVSRPASGVRPGNAGMVHAPRAVHEKVDLALTARKAICSTPPATTTSDESSDRDAFPDIPDWPSLIGRRAPLCIGVQDTSVGRVRGAPVRPLP